MVKHRAMVCCSRFVLRLLLLSPFRTLGETQFESGRSRREYRHFTGLLTSAGHASPACKLRTFIQNQIAPPLLFSGGELHGSTLPLTEQWVITP
jgi:hypothetical protein